MFLCAVLPLMWTLVALPVSTVALFAGARDFQRRQIAVDNAAIVLGRGTRAALGGLASAASALAHVDRAHDPAHACAQTGDGPCVAIDRNLELAMEAAVLLAEGRAQAQYALAAASARAAAAKLGVGIRIERAPRLPFRRRACPNCGQTVGWDLDPRALAARVVEKAPVDPVRVDFRQASGWDYAIRPFGGGLP